MSHEWTTSDDGSEPVVEIGCDGCGRVTRLTGDQLLALAREYYERPGAPEPLEEPCARCRGTRRVI